MNNPIIFIYWCPDALIIPGMKLVGRSMFALKLDPNTTGEWIYGPAQIMGNERKYKAKRVARQ